MNSKNAHSPWYALFFTQKDSEPSFRYKELLFQSCLLTNLNFFCGTMHPKCPLAFSNDILSWSFFLGERSGDELLLAFTICYTLLACTLHPVMLEHIRLHEWSDTIWGYLEGGQDWPLEQKPDTETQPCSSGCSLWIQRLASLESKSPQCLHGLQSAKWCFLLSASGI